MDLLMNGLLLAATLFAGGYCWVLSRRVEALKSLDKGLGGSIVTLTRQIELARLTLDEARTANKDRRQDLAQLVTRAEAATGQLRMLLAVVPPAPAAPAHTPAAYMPAQQDPRANRENPAAVISPLTAPAKAPLTGGPVPLSVALPEPEQAAAPVLRAVQTPGSTAELESDTEPEGDTRPALAEVPKPRAFGPVENPLRRAKPALAQTAGRAAATPSASSSGSEEADLLEALSALAGTGAR